MGRMNRIEFTRQSFERNREIVEKDLGEMREYAHNLQDFRHHRTIVGPLTHIAMYPFYLWERRKLVRLIRVARWKVRFYRKIEKDLEYNDLGSAIEALSLFAPREETTMEIIHRVRTSPATLWAIQRSPNVIRENMLILRDELLKIKNATS